MSEAFVSIETHNEFARRIDAENKTQNERISRLEDSIGQISELTISVRELAVNMQNMVKEQGKMGARLEEIENKPAKNWDKLIWAISGAVIAGVIGFALKSIGM